MKTALMLCTAILFLGSIPVASAIADETPDDELVNPEPDTADPVTYVWVWDPISEEWVKVPV